jgi:hypothetical protein
MRHGRRVAALGAAVLTVMTAVGCSSSSDDDVDASSSGSSSPLNAATAAPGTYGSPVDPSLPNPTGVATDAPATSTPGSAGIAQVEVVVTYSGWDDALGGVEVGAYVAGIAETGGTCTLTLTSVRNSATASTPGEPEASSTSCPGLVVPGSELSSGNWTAVVSYESPAAQGESDSVAVVVP